MNYEMQAEAIQELASAVRNIGIFPTDAATGRDVNGGHVASLTEAVMGVSKSLQNIANAIDRLADTIHEHQ